MKNMNTLLDLLRAIVVPTESGRVTWEVLDEDAFRAQLKEGSIVISHDMLASETGDGQEVESYRVIVSNARSQTVERASFTAGSDPAGFEIIKGVFAKAKDNALNTNDLL